MDTLPVLHDIHHAWTKRTLRKQMKAAQTELGQEHAARVEQLNGDIAQLQEQVAATRSAAEILEAGVYPQCVSGQCKLGAFSFSLFSSYA